VSVGVGDEQPHAPGTELAWCESYWFELHNTAEGLGGSARLDVRPNEGTREASLSFFLPDGGFITARHVAPWTTADPSLEVEGVSFALVEPARRWRLTYDGPAHSLGSARDADRPEAWRKSRLERLSVELDVTTPHDPIALAGGFVQPASVSGEVWVSGDRYALDALGMRGKAWGAAAVPLAARRVSLSFAPDRAMLVERRTLDDARTDLTGFVLHDGALARVVEVELATEAEPGSEILPRSFRLALRDEHGCRHEVGGEVTSLAPLPGFRGRRENLLCVAVARAQWAGVAGFGFAEYLHRLDANGSPLEPVRDTHQKL